MINPLYWLHMQHKKLFSAFRFWRLGFSCRSFPDHIEREFVLAFASVMRGEGISIYDIGAATGHFSAAIAKLENVRQVESFEPIPVAFQALQQRLASYPHVHCHNVALGSANGSADLHLSGSSDSSSLLPVAREHESVFPGTQNIGRISVRVACLDDYVDQHKLTLPDVIKIDVQGYEVEVLKGASRALAHARHCILETSFVSLYEGSPLFEEVYAFMLDNGFLLRGVGRPLEDRSGRQLQVDAVFSRPASAS
jgi:FkbM family methyltransferase